MRCDLFKERGRITSRLTASQRRAILQAFAQLAAGSQLNGAFRNFIRKITMRLVQTLRPFQTLCLILIGFVSAGFAETLTVPATTAYFKPDSRSLRMTGEGVAGWTDSKKSVVWFGWLGRAGDLTSSVKVELPDGETASYSLSISAVFS